MIVDCHVMLGRHFTGENTTLDAYVREMEKHSIDRALICPHKPHQ